MKHRKYKHWMVYCKKLIGDALGQICRVEEKAAWGQLAGKKQHMVRLHGDIHRGSAAAALKSRLRPSRRSSRGRGAGLAVAGSGRQSRAPEAASDLAPRLWEHLHVPGAIAKDCEC